MEKSQKLKEAILSQYKSVRNFATEMNIPYSTLSTALNGKIEGMAYGTVLSICKQLKLNPIDFNPLSVSNKMNKIVNDTHLSYYYSKLNSKGQNQALEILKDMTELKKYTDADN